MIWRRLGQRLRAASTGLLPLARTPGDLGQPSVSVNICRIAELRSFPHQLTLSRNSRLALLCVRQRTELPNPREFARY